MVTAPVATYTTITNVTVLSFEGHRFVALTLPAVWTAIRAETIVRAMDVVADKVTKLQEGRHCTERP